MSTFSSIIAMLLVLALSGPASANSNPLIDLLKRKGVITEQEAGDLERQLREYYEEELGRAGSTTGGETPQAAAAPAPPQAALPAGNAHEGPGKQAAGRNRVNWGGEARFRIMDEYADTPAGWAGSKLSLSGTTAEAGGKQVFGIKSAGPVNTGGRADRGIGFPTRLRLNWDAQVIPDWVDVWGRFTVNKRWGTFSATPESDPFNAPNSFAASIGSELVPRAEQFYATIKVPYLPWETVWYLGRLPGLDGPPARQARSIFPRLFIDSEIDGTLLKVGLPKLPTGEACLAIGQCPMEGLNATKARGGPTGPYQAKVEAENALFLGYLDYQESKLAAPTGKDSVAAEDFVPLVGHGPSSDVILGQLQLKLLKDTQLILDALWMPDWYMPRQDFAKDNSFTQAISPKFNPTGGKDGTGSWTPGLDIPFFTSDYLLWGGYVDTQLLGFQLYGSLYFSHLDVPPFAYQMLLPNADGTLTRSTPVRYEGHGFNGYIWHVGFGTGPWLAKWNLSFGTEYAQGSNAWINPFNYRGFRRKGTVLYPEANSFFGGNQVVGFYPFNAGVLDSYLDYYWKKVKFRGGVMYFDYDRHGLPALEGSGTDLSAGGPADRIFGWSRYQTQWWPYFEVLCTF